MKAGKVFLFAVERVFDVLDLIALVSDRRKAKKKTKELTLEDLVGARRDGELLRRSQAPTVVIPPPSEREKRR